MKILIKKNRYQLSWVLDGYTISSNVLFNKENFERSLAVGTHHRGKYWGMLKEGNIWKKHELSKHYGYIISTLLKEHI
jgi:hypothetical protein